MGGRKSDKKYSNATFSKRVDHEAGRHHTARAAPEPGVCEICGDVYADRRWSAPATATEKYKPTTLDFGTREGLPVVETTVEKQHPHILTPQRVVCPACQRQRDQTPSGFVHLDGGFLDTHPDDIRKLLHNEAERAAENNPLARIMGWENDAQGRLTVTTTTEHLAQRLGHALQKAFKGKTRYDFSHENKLAHVYWRRD
ncbi:MAG: BCAM0308 family protein [Blastocatellia bacterium]